MQNSNRSVDEYQTQCVAIGDGVDYEKYAGNPVLDAHDLPEGSSISDFRDPKIWQDSDDTYRCVAANRAADGSGQILLFSSRDALHWQFKSVLLKNENRFGEMWECPDLFELDGKWVLLLSAMDMLPQGMKYTCGNEALCLIGAFDGEHGTLTAEMDQPIDGGIDFYAPQTMRMPDGCRVMIGWMQNPHISAHSPRHGKWMGQMSLPRELYWKEGRLCQTPIRELELLRTNRVEYRNVMVNGPLTLDGIEGRVADLELTIQPASSEQYGSLSIYFAQNEKFRTSLIFDPLNSTMTIDRPFSGTRRAFLHRRTIKVEDVPECLKLRMILDRYSAEIFINDGVNVMTATFYTELSAEEISFFCDGTAIIRAYPRIKIYGKIATEGGGKDGEKELSVMDNIRCFLGSSKR